MAAVLASENRRGKNVSSHVEKETSHSSEAAGIERTSSLPHDVDVHVRLSLAEATADDQRIGSLVALRQQL